MVSWHSSSQLSQTFVTFQVLKGVFSEQAKLKYTKIYIYLLRMLSIYRLIRLLSITDGPFKESSLIEQSRHSARLT